MLVITHVPLLCNKLPHPTGFKHSFILLPDSVDLDFRRGWGGLFLLQCAGRRLGGWLDGLGLGYLEAPSFTCLASGLGCTWRLGPQTGAPSSGLSSQHQASQNSYVVAQSSRCEYPSKQDRDRISVKIHIHVLCAKGTGWYTGKPYADDVSHFLKIWTVRALDTC